MKSFASIAVGCLLVAVAPLARAGEAGAALSKCLVEAATPADRTALVRWVFGALSVHPDLKGLVTVDEATRTSLDRGAAAVFERLVAQDCAPQSRRAIVEEGTSGYGDAFRTLGELAMGQFVEQKDVQAGMARIAAHMDQERILKALLSK